MEDSGSRVQGRLHGGLGPWGAAGVQGVGDSLRGGSRLRQGWDDVGARAESIACLPQDPLDAAGYYQLALAAAVDLGNKKAQMEIDLAKVRPLTGKTDAAPPGVVPIPV